MSETPKNQNCSIACWVAGVIVGLLLFFMMRPGMGFLLALILALIVAGLIIWCLKTFFCMEDVAESSASAASEQKADTAPRPTAPYAAQPAAPSESVDAVKEPEAAPADSAVAATEGTADFDGDGVHEGTDEGSQPAGLPAPRDGGADDLKMIKGVGPALEKQLHGLGFFHFDQIANWSVNEVAWVNANLKGFKGRVTRDNWIEQSRILASGGETEFSQRVEDGDVY